MDPDPRCLLRWCRWVYRIHPCPPSGLDASGYLRATSSVLRRERFDVLLPTHEQAWLFAVGRRHLPEGVGLAVSGSEAFAKVQSKIAFAELLDELGLPQPAWCHVAKVTDLPDWAYPFCLKAAYSTAGRGVRLVRNRDEAEATASALLAGSTGEVMAQKRATGDYAQVGALFHDGSLVAVHTSGQRAIGMGGSAAARLSVDHRQPREDVARLGRHLAWHGGLTMDYLHVDGQPYYLECNPRTVEPGNAAASGVNLPELQLRLSVHIDAPAHPVIGRRGIRTHGLMAILLGVADATHRRRAVLAELARAVARMGTYRDSAEQLTPVLRDPPSAIPLLVVLARLLALPASASAISAETVGRYAVRLQSIRRLTPHRPGTQGIGADHDGA